MSHKIDFDVVNSCAIAAYPGLLLDWLPDGEIHGHELKARNPTRSDGKPGSFSISIDSGKWADFAVDGASGKNAISLYAYLYSVDYATAGRELAAKLGLDDEDPNKVRDIKKRYDKVKAKKPKRAKLTPILPVPKSAPRKLPNHPAYGKPSTRWTYKNEKGELLGFVCRFDLGDGKKETFPLTFCHEENKPDRWAWKGFPNPTRPLYGLDRLAANPKANVLIIEGEKCADAAQRLFPKLVCIAWPGGGKAVEYVDFSPLAGRNVIIWPDNDEPGLATAEKIKEQLTDCKNIAVIDPPSNEEKGWDVADAEEEGWSQEFAIQWLKERVAKAQGKETTYEPKEEQQPDPTQDQVYDGPPDYDPPINYEDIPDQFEPQQPQFEEFRVLGYNRGTYYYLPSASSQVVELTPSAHTKLNLLQLAPLQFWENNYPKKGGADWDMAANALMNQSHMKGVFRPHERRRGRGAWDDDGKSVLHVGPRLIVDGQPISPIDFQTNFTYEGDSPLGIENLEPATTKEANELVAICKSIRWEKQLSGLLLSGWCVVAPICGVLNWRPHIWITGGAGSGKSTVMRDIIGRVVGPTALQVESKTTEAGIRAELSFDARPVIFDEAEAEDERSAQRMQGNLDLARVASSESGGVMYKGTATGKSIGYRIRSCFCFSSINTSVNHYADETRVTMLVLGKIRQDTEEQRQMSEAHYAELMTSIYNHLTPEFSSKLVMRSMQHLQTLKKNIETFTYAASIALGNRRIGDQIGPMLAGAYLCHSTKEISLEAAQDWIAQHDFTDHAAMSVRDDEQRLLQHIIENRVRVSGGNGTNYERSVGELIGGILEEGGDQHIASDICQSTLRRNGIRVEKPDLMTGVSGCVYISTTSEAIKRILKGTQWSSNWRRPLLSINGAISSKGVRFTPALATPAVALPINTFLNTDE